MNNELFSLEAYKNAYEESDDFAIQFNNTNVAVEFECSNYDERSDEYSACEQILQIFYYINEFIEDGVVPNELSDKSELNTTQTIAKEHAEIYFIDNVSKLNVIEEIEKFKTLLSNEALNDQLRNQKYVMISLFNALDNDSAKQSLACALLDFVNKYPEDIDTMNLIYLGEGFDLNLCQ